MAGINYDDVRREAPKGFLLKPEKRQKVKDRADRLEAQIEKQVREACEVRDGYCLVQKLGLPGCKGRSEWAHFAGHRRSQTAGMHPSRRHDTRFSGMLCTRHHSQEEDDLFHVVYTTDKYADGPVKWEAVSAPKTQRSAT
jgi:hypothetical protein